MSEKKILITNTLTQPQKSEAAKLFYQSFIPKFHHLWFYNKNEEEVYSVLRNVLNYKYGIYAILDHKVVGILGMDFGTEKSFLDLNLSAFTDTFGFFGGMCRYLKNIGEDLLVHTRAHALQPRIHPIAVAEEVRGKGVGGKLMKAFEQYSRKAGCTAMALEVVDNNPGAIKLYEREGYVKYRYLPTSLFTGKAGFQGIYYMKKNLIT